MTILCQLYRCLMKPKCRGHQERRSDETPEVVKDFVYASAPDVLKFRYLDASQRDLAAVSATVLDVM